MVSVTIKIDTRDIVKYLGKIDATLDAELTTAINEQAQKVMRSAIFLAPRDTGDLRAGIYTQQQANTKNVKKSSISWRETSPRRAASFKKSKGGRWDNFVAWMHNSQYAREGFRWQTGIPNFFDVAIMMNRDTVIRDIEMRVDKSIK